MLQKCNTAVDRSKPANNLYCKRSQQKSHLYTHCHPASTLEELISKRQTGLSHMCFDTCVTVCAWEVKPWVCDTLVVVPSDLSAKRSPQPVYLFQSFVVMIVPVCVFVYLVMLWWVLTSSLTFPLHASAARTWASVYFCIWRWDLVLLCHLCDIWSSLCSGWTGQRQKGQTVKPYLLWVFSRHACHFGGAVLTSVCGCNCWLSCNLANVRWFLILAGTLIDLLYLTKLTFLLNNFITMLEKQKGKF